MSDYPNLLLTTAAGASGGARGINLPPRTSEYLVVFGWENTVEGVIENLVLEQPAPLLEPRTSGNVFDNGGHLSLTLGTVHG